ncbi:MAG: MoaD/ThiS family protein [Hyphomicrobiales bacterium]
MKVQVSLFANLRDYAPGGEGNFDLALAAGATVADLFAALNVPPQVQAVVLVNGRRAEPATPLSPEDAVTLFPPMEGG